MKSTAVLRCRRLRSAFTLVEALVAVTMTLIIMLALAQGFKRLSDDISQGRARLASSDQLRSLSEVLRNDLANLTVDVDPTNGVAKSGYFVYYEGPLSDSSAVMAPINNLGFTAGTIEQNLSASKFGDIDDVLMFTAKSDGDYFKGQVPLALVKGRAAYDQAVAAGNPTFTYTPSLDDWEKYVTVASEYAEIAYFMMPINPANRYMVPSEQDTLPIRPMDADVSVNPGASAQTTNAGSIDLLGGGTVGNGIPDGLILCRRVNLILPGLNAKYPTGTTGTTSSDALTYTANALSSDPSRIDALGHRQMLALNSLDTSVLAVMQNSAQRGDISVRRVRDASLTSNFSPIVANSLEDLANPANRFAHGMVFRNATTATQPLLLTDSSIPLQRYEVSSSTTLPTAGTMPCGGFLRPEFMRRKTGYVDDDNNTATPPVYSVTTISGTDFLALNAIAFDVKGFDPAVAVLFNPGPDNDAGLSSSTTDTFGAAGSDDLVVLPGDPGYNDSVQLIRSGTATLTAIQASRGAFVDLGWGFKSPSSFMAATDSAVSLITTPLSGLEVGVQGGSQTLMPARSLLKSGAIVGSQSPAGTVRSLEVFQPRFDSFTPYFESDGYVQEEYSSPNYGSIFQASDRWNLNSSNNYAGRGPDRAINNLDDNANGQIDEYEEQDSSPPILIAMPSIQATIRVEDKTAAVIQQISVTQSLID